VKRIAVAVAAGTTALMAQAVKAGPQVLTASQMDRVTAGSVYVDVFSLAGAVGDSTRSFTDTNVQVMSSQWFELGFGIAVAKSFACCGPDVQVYAAALGTTAGDEVRTNTHAAEHQGGLVAVAISMVTVFVISQTPGGPFRSLVDTGLSRPVPR
jgi:hypothetical protein